MNVLVLSLGCETWSDLCSSSLRLDWAISSKVSVEDMVGERRVKEVVVGGREVWMVGGGRYVRGML